ncbi:ABC transporter permease [Reyranella sp.]|jgi:peptide/nickel transport system permease protein|uniref:ABC transporter permease n=1 Tax=Reyranella sp. TaxID=1929291 RepID=UPI000BD4CE34|nr:ABC transporter permease [Reyranella sp.]OYY45110.1 MAG: ABC transporter permease [Rhodospirillales bacterium 35-66-84]OYZ95576.1 MAG: ABC transporter permease [Rhodospirillales bacterium 24-66-33]OZB27094.1 MAG: ABC transporter permease [Rhodospirillales bacterium 39-66-50]HQS16912.1 ABC transporter permease [Reyranella sp.]HQT12603.1 ABC transporter permease [Reyranella sp.]
MLLYALRRLIYLVPVAFGVSLLVFALVHLAPGDPISAIVPPDAPKEVVDKLKEYYGFDQPLPVQYLRWLGVTLTGDLGTSIGTGRSVAAEVGSAFGNTIILAIAATLLAFSLAVILGTAAAYAKSRIVDRLVTVISLIGVSVPHFWLAIVLVIIFAVELGVLPPMGIGPENSTGWQFDRAHLAHMVLPTIALSVIPLGVVTRTVRSTVKETLSMEFVTALQAKGMRDSRILFHVLKNAAPTCLAVMGLQAGNLIGGSILIETVFAWPGTGFLLNSAIFRRDLPILQGTTLVLAGFFMLLNLTVDIIQTMVDPRIKRG